MKKAQKQVGVDQKEEIPNDSKQELIFSREEVVLEKSPSEKSQLLNEEPFISALPKDKIWGFGATVGNKDCFYDACAQALSFMSQDNNKYTVKSLRLLCSDYIYELDKELPASNWIKDAIENNIVIDDYESHVAAVQYTQEEMAKFKQESNVYTGYAIEGKSFIEGIILANKLNINIHLIEFQESKSSMEPIESSHVLITSTKAEIVKKEKINYQNNMLIHLAMYNSHFVPILPNEYLQQKCNLKVFFEKNPELINDTKSENESSVSVNEHASSNKKPEALNQNEQEKFVEMAFGAVMQDNAELLEVLLNPTHQSENNLNISAIEKLDRTYHDNVIREHKIALYKKWKGIFKKYENTTLQKNDSSLNKELNDVFDKSVNNATEGYKDHLDPKNYYFDYNSGQISSLTEKKRKELCTHFRNVLLNHRYNYLYEITRFSTIPVAIESIEEYLNKTDKDYEHDFDRNTKLKSSNDNRIIQWEKRAERRNELIKILLKYPRFLPKELAYKSYDEISEFLLKSKVDIDCVDSHGNSFMHYAAKMDYIHMASFLESQCINLEIKNKIGQLFFEFAGYESKDMYLSKINSYNHSRKEFLERARSHFDSYGRLSKKREDSILFRFIYYLFYKENADKRKEELHKYLETYEEVKSLGLNEEVLIGLIIETAASTKRGVLNDTQLHKYPLSLVKDYNSPEGQRRRGLTSVRGGIGSEYMIKFQSLEFANKEQKKSLK